MKKPLSLLLAFFLMISTVPAYASGIKEGAASLFLPTTGQAMNNELGATKTKVMATVEVAAITTITILGLASSAGVVWVGLGPLIANHLWSATDAYKSAKQKDDPIYQAQIVEAEHTLELSRQRRFGRNPEAGSIDIRRRVQMAGERAY